MMAFVTKLKLKILMVLVNLATRTLSWLRDGKAEDDLHKQVYQIDRDRSEEWAKRANVAYKELSWWR